MSEIKLSKKFEPLFEWLGCKEGNPLHKVDTVVITGGRYSQKSFGVGLFSCVASKDYAHRILYTRYTLTSAEDSIIPEFKEKLDILNCQADFNVQKDRIEGIKNQSKIVFKGVKTSSGNQTANLKSLKNFSVFILEEAEEMTSFDNWDKIRKSIRSLDVRNLSILILNPTTKEHWVYTELFEARGVNEGFNGVKGNVLYIHSSYLDIEREFIADNIFEDFEEKRGLYEEYEALSKEEKQYASPMMVKAWNYFKYVVLGGWLNSAEGVIYTNWEIGEFREVAPSVYGQDYGFSIDPTTLIQTSIDKSRKIIYAKELLYRPKLTTSQIAAFNLEYAGKSIIYADSAEPRLIEELKKLGCNIKEAVKGPGSISAGIALLQDFKLVIDPNSVNLLKELNNYVWHDKKSNTPVDLWNHGLDSLRYSAYSQHVMKKLVWNFG